jgi:hypothetical protein
LVRGETIQTAPVFQKIERRPTGVGVDEDQRGDSPSQRNLSKFCKKQVAKGKSGTPIPTLGSDSDIRKPGDLGNPGMGNRNVRKNPKKFVQIQETISMGSTPNVSRRGSMGQILEDSSNLLSEKSHLGGNSEIRAGLGGSRCGVNVPSSEVGTQTRAVDLGKHISGSGRSVENTTGQAGIKIGTGPNGFYPKVIPHHGTMNGNEKFELGDEMPEKVEGRNIIAKSDFAKPATTETVLRDFKQQVSHLDLAHAKKTTLVKIIDFVSDAKNGDDLCKQILSFLENFWEGTEAKFFGGAPDGPVSQTISVQLMGKKSNEPNIMNPRAYKNLLLNEEMVRDQTLQTKNFQIKFPGNNVSNKKKSTQQDEYTTTMRGSSQPNRKMAVPPRTDASDAGETELMRKTTVIGFGSRDTSQGKLMSKTAQSWAPKRKNMKILKNIIRQNAGGADGGSGDEAAEQNSNTNLYEHTGRYSYKDCEIPDDLVTVWAKNTPNTFMNKFIECGDREFVTKASVKGKSGTTGHPRVQKSPGTYISLGDRKYLTSMNKTSSMLNASMQDFTRLGLLLPDAVKPQANNTVSKPKQGNH